ncbi:lytic transglycosylase domain-containing protein [Rhodanobacter sp. DHG33]|uniref:lytic transglycosylase domain-containing protein n=1 Tax=Rhodanobacter sp. DHG33 TaxID=2775921 RepID=UPI001782B440|nr:lytic transglycosylase domain-containing protein [Rhodanobacter sp. DHG33]MBD8899270.1 transglycosylase SLT domain-containing protein [Rhodanobacter sp. DHG33]
MFEAARHRGRAGRLEAGSPPKRPLFRSILGRIALGCALLAGALWLPGAHAGVLYRCTGASGETVFTGNTAGYRSCHKLGDYGTPARRKSPASLEGVRGVAVGTRTQAETASTLLATVKGSVFTTAKATAADPLPSASAVPPGLRGHWTYSQASDGDAALPGMPAAAAPSDRVLRGAVYRIARADGSVEYTNIPPAGHAAQTAKMLFTYIATCFACNLHSNIHWGSVPLDVTDYADVIRAASVEYGVDEAFIRAIIHAESAFNPRAMSIKGAQGLMQLMPGTAGDMGVLDAFDSAQNIRGGARYLAMLLRDFNGNEHLAAAAYNAGPAAVQKYNGIPPYAETQVYVERVDTLRKRYEVALHPPLAAARPG